MYPYPELYILRHGETLWNQQGRLQGQKDSPLTDKGRQQALAQGEVLRSVKSLPHIVFVSPLGRTLTRANLAVPFIKTHLKDPRLLEINFGAWEGATRDAISQKIKAPVQGSEWFFESPGGETFQMISRRVMSFLQELEDPAIIVTHAVTSKVLRSLYLGLDQADLLKLPAEQGCIYHLYKGTEAVLRSALVGPAMQI
ncbi:histidine phosphatase family protein [Rhodobacteraceae bacterium]|nr:histidine phosphatase family protein [Paracoccaceae bacterium]